MSLKATIQQSVYATRTLVPGHVIKEDNKLAWPTPSFLFSVHTEHKYRVICQHTETEPSKRSPFHQD